MIPLAILLVFKQLLNHSHKNLSRLLLVSTGYCVDFFLSYSRSLSLPRTWLESNKTWHTTNFLLVIFSTLCLILYYFWIALFAHNCLVGFSETRGLYVNVQNKNQLLWGKFCVPTTNIHICWLKMYFGTETVFLMDFRKILRA